MSYPDTPAPRPSLGPTSGADQHVGPVAATEMPVGHTATPELELCGWDIPESQAGAGPGGHSAPQPPPDNRRGPSTTSQEGSPRPNDISSTYVADSHGRVSAEVRSAGGSGSGQPEGRGARKAGPGSADDAKASPSEGNAGQGRGAPGGAPGPGQAGERSGPSEGTGTTSGKAGAKPSAEDEVAALVAKLAQSVAAGAPAESGPAAKDRARKPTSARQVEANRRNAQRSTGPKSGAGKQCSAQNAIKHGVWVRKSARMARGLPPEELERIKAVDEKLVAELGPGHPVLEASARRIAEAMSAQARVAFWREVVLREAEKVDPSDDELDQGWFARNPLADRPWVVLYRA